MLPPYARPLGPELPLPELLESFLAGADDGFSAEAHVEGPQLLVARMIPVAVRLGPRSLLVRADTPEEAVATKAAIEFLLASSGLRKVEPKAALGDVAAIQITAVRGGEWDLWGEEAGPAHRDLERAVLGDDEHALTEPAHSADQAVGMNLEDLLDDIEKKGP